MKIDYNNEKIDYVKDTFGIWHQVNPQKFNYDNEYLKILKSSKENLYLRLGFLISNFESDFEFSSKDSLELGPGNMEWQDLLNNKKIFNKNYFYDVNGNSNISETEIYTRKFDFLFLFDVYEHFINLDDLFKINFTYCILTCPSLPSENITFYKHLKPNEHLHHFNIKSICKYLQSKNQEILRTSYIESIERDGFNSKNILTILIKNNK